MKKISFHKPFLILCIFLFLSFKLFIYDIYKCLVFSNISFNLAFVHFVRLMTETGIEGSVNAQATIDGTGCKLRSQRRD